MAVDGGASDDMLRLFARMSGPEWIPSVRIEDRPFVERLRAVRVWIEFDPAEGSVSDGERLLRELQLRLMQRP